MIFRKEYKLDKRSESEKDINKWDELASDIAGICEGYRGQLVKKEKLTPLLDSGKEAIQISILNFLKENKDLTKKSIPQFVYDQDCVYIEDYSEAMFFLEYEINKLKTKQKNYLINSKKNTILKEELFNKILAEPNIKESIQDKKKKRKNKEKIKKIFQTKINGKINAKVTIYSKNKTPKIKLQFKNI